MNQNSLVSRSAWAHCSHGASSGGGGRDMGYSGGGGGASRTMSGPKESFNQDLDDEIPF